MMEFLFRIIRSFAWFKKTIRHDNYFGQSFINGYSKKCIFALLILQDMSYFFIKIKNFSGFLCLLLMLLLVSCNPPVTRNIIKTYPTLPYMEEVKVIPLSEEEPNGSELLGEISSGDLGYAHKKTTYEAMVDYAKIEARKIGGNAIKITRYIKPYTQNAPPKLTFIILKIPNSPNHN